MKAQARGEIYELTLVWYNTKTDWIALRDTYFQVK